MKRIHFLLIITMLVSVSFNLNIQAQEQDDKLDIAYNFLSSGKTDEAIPLFEDHLKSYPGDIQVCMQLAYAYEKIGNTKKAIEYFTFVTKSSASEKEILQANNELKYLNTPNTTNTDNELDKAFSFISKGDYDKAIDVIEKYKLKHPDDVKLDLQLAYLYSNQKLYEKSLERFKYVADNSENTDDIDAASQSMYYLHDMVVQNSPLSFDIYAYNAFDTYYNNTITSSVAHLNFKISKRVYTGFYSEINMDVRSNKTTVYNDRYVEGGQFVKYIISENLGFELRTGYVREFDFDKNGINFKPILYGGTRIGNPSIYLGEKNSRTNFVYFDLYSMALYDYKFGNFFGQLLTKEVLRSMAGEYSYFEFYLQQMAMADSRRYNFNNFVELGFGVSFKPNIMNFPSLFIEASNKTYYMGDNDQFFQGALRNTFQFKAGILINLNTIL